MNIEGFFISKYARRGFGYALTSYLALLSGYFITTQNSEFKLDLLIASIPFVLSTPFFQIYALCFHYSPVSENHENRSILDIAIWVGLPFLIFAIALYLLSGYVEKALCPSVLLYALILYALMFYGYGFFLLEKFRKNSDITVRHQLIWPVVLSIAISMYYGLTLNKVVLASSSPVPFFYPIVIIILIFVLSELIPLSKNKFLFFCLVASFSPLLILIFLVGFNLIEESTADCFYKMLFCLYIAAYLAVFEAWRICCYKAKNVNQTQVNKNICKNDVIYPEWLIAIKKKLYPLNPIIQKTTKPSDDKNEYEDILITKTSKYFFATLAATTVSSVLIPFTYIFTRYGTLFLVCFCIHSIWAFCYWNVIGYNLDKLKNNNWVKLKTISGFIFLSLLVIDSYKSSHPEGHRFKDFLSISGIAFLLVLAAPCITLLFRDFLKHITTYTSQNWMAFFYQRRTYFRFASLMAFVFAFLIYILKELSQPAGGEQGSLIFLKSTNAFIAYCFLIILALFAEIGMQILNRNKEKVKQEMDTTPSDGFQRRHFSEFSFILNVSRKVIGFSLTTRLITCSVIGITVIIPFLSHGNTLLDAISSALPFLLAAMGGFALNDYFDSDKDKINRPRRAIPSGKLKPYEVLFISLNLLAVGFLISIITSDNYIELTLYLLAIVGVAFYNLVVRAFALIKTLYTAILCTIPVLYDILFLNYTNIYLIFPFATVLYIVGREFLMDAKDITGDRESGIVTLPMIVGERYTVKLGFSLQLLCVILVFIIVISKPTLWNLVLFSLMFITVFSVIILWNIKSGKYQRMVISVLLIPMVCGILMLI